MTGEGVGGGNGDSPVAGEGVASGDSGAVGCSIAVAVPRGGCALGCEVAVPRGGCAFGAVVADGVAELSGPDPAQVASSVTAMLMVRREITN